MTLEQNSKPQYKSKAVRKRWEDANAHIDASLRMSAQWQDTTWRDHTIEVMVQNWANPDWRRTRIISIALSRDYTSEDYRRKQHLSHVGKKHSEVAVRKMSEVRGGVKNKALPFLLRGGIVDEVSTLTGIPHESVRRLRDDQRRRGGLPKSSLQQQKEARSKAHIGKPRNAHGREIAEGQRHEIDFLRVFIEKGRFSEELSLWEELKALYEAEGRESPSDFYKRLRLELFALSLQDADHEREYTRVKDELYKGKQDPLTDEEVFIRKHLQEVSANAVVEDIYTTYSTLLFTTVYQILRDVDETSDIVGKIYLDFLERGVVKYASIETDEERKKFLIRVAMNKALDVVRRRNTLPKKGIVFVAVDPRIAENSHIQQIRSAEDQYLGQAQYGELIAQAPIAALVNQGYSLGEIAQVNNTTVGRIKAKNRRDKERIRKTSKGK